MCNLLQRIRTTIITRNFLKHSFRSLQMKGDLDGASGACDACYSTGFCDFKPAIKVRNVIGVEVRSNDLLYCPPFTDPDDSKNGIVIFFGGDLQDFHENMVDEEELKEFTDWSLENTAKMLSTHYKNCHVIIVRPSSIEDGIFSNYTNFVPSFKYGVPKFVPNHDSLRHLDKLVQNLQNTLKILDYEEIKTRLEDTCRELKLGRSFFPTEAEFKRDLSDCYIELVGFSKGCVVLNQLLHEFNHFKGSNVEEVTRFIDRIRVMRWMDGGHSGRNGTWITSEEILANYAKMGKRTFVDVTPYQVRCPKRPWIRKEEEIFTRTLTVKNLDIERKLHLEDAECTLDNHFKLLREVFTPTP